MCVSVCVFMCVFWLCAYVCVFVIVFASVFLHVYVLFASYLIRYILFVLSSFIGFMSIDSFLYKNQ